MRSVFKIGLIMLALGLSLGAESSERSKFLASLSAAGGPWMLCLQDAAKSYGTKSCHSPSELLPAVRSSCYDASGQIRSLMNTRPDLLSSDPDHMMEALWNMMEPELTQLMVDAQIERSCP